MKKLFAALAVALLSACSQIDTGNVGVESTVGQVKQEELAPGVYFTMFKKVTEISAKENAFEVNDLKPKSKDNLTMADMDITVYFRIDPSKAADLMVKYAGDLTGPDKDGAYVIGQNLVIRMVREAAYKAAADIPAAEMHTKRTDIAASVMKSVQTDLDREAGKGSFVVANVIVRNIVTDPALEASIKEAGKAQFELARKAQEVEIAKKEAERQRIQAQGEADAIRIKTEAISKQGGDDYVKLKAIEKWDGKLPTVTGNAVPMIGIK